MRLSSTDINPTRRPDRGIPDVPIKPLVLVIEDHDDTRMLLSYVLKNCGCDVFEAEDGDVGLRLANSLKPDLILMDTTLPRLDGVTVTRLIRQVHVLRDVPIFFLSGHALPEYRLKALAAGGNEYFVKPLKLRDLEAAVRKQLAQKRGIFEQ